MHMYSFKGQNIIFLGCKKSVKIDAWGKSQEISLLVTCGNPDYGENSFGYQTVLMPGNFRFTIPLKISTRFVLCYGLIMVEFARILQGCSTCTGAI